MRIAFVFASIILCVFSAVAQSIPLTGTVAIQNSQYETGKRQFVKGASIRAPFAKATTSDRLGRFVVELRGVAAGASLRLTVDHPSLAVVNVGELERVVAGGRNPVDVVMADPESLAREQARLYRVAIASVEEAHAKKLAEVERDQLSLQQRIHRAGLVQDSTMQDLAGVMTAIQAQRDEAFAHAATLSRELSLVDLDRVSVTYQRAYACLQNGQLDSVMIWLDPDSLRQDMEQAFDQGERGRSIIEKADRNIYQTVQAHRLRMNVRNARLEFGEALAEVDRMRVIVAEHAEVFSARERIELHDLEASVREMMGDHRGALTASRTAIAMYRTELPGDALGIAIHRDLLAGRMATMGLLDSALIEQREALNGILLHGDSTSHEAIAAHHHLGRILRLLGQYEPALMELGSALRLCANHNDELTEAGIIGSIGSVLHDKGDFRGAIDRYHVEIDMVTHRLGKDHPSTASTWSDIGSAWHELGNYDSSRTCFERALRIGREALGRDHPANAAILGNMANVEYSLGNYTSTLALLEEVLNVQKVVYGVDHVESISTLANIGMIHNAQGDHDKAIAIEEEVLQKRIRLLGSQHADVARSYGLVAYSYRMAGRNDTALVLMRIALDGLVAALGPDHPEVGTTHNNIGWVLEAMGDHAAAIQEIRKAIDIAIRAFGEDHSDISAARNNLAAMLHRSGDHSGAVVEQRLALQAMRVQLGPDHDWVGLGYGSLGVFLENTEERDSALFYLEASKRIAIQRLGPDHDHVAQADERIAAYHGRAKAYDLAEHHYTETIRITTKNHGPDHTRLGEYYFYLGRMQREAQRYEAAGTALVEARRLMVSPAPSKEMYKLFLDRSDDENAWRWALDFLGRCSVYPGCPEKRSQEDIAGLRSLANRLGRTDDLKEFGLE